MRKSFLLLAKYSHRLYRQGWLEKKLFSKPDHGFPSAAGGRNQIKGIALNHGLAQMTKEPLGGGSF
jgi:hypothetical protein